MIQTERLILRKPYTADIDGLFEFLGNAEAMAFTHTDATWRYCRKRVLEKAGLVEECYLRERPRYLLRRTSPLAAA